MKSKLIFLFALFVSMQMFGFEPEPSVIDTIHLDEITTYADHVKYQPGSKIVSFNAEQLSTAASGGIDQLISRLTPIYIKTDAGGLSTIRIRGTAPDHTSINFGGININSLTLGHSNASKIPAFLFDKLDIQFGGSSAINGSGAIGGAIYLGNLNSWTNGVKAEISTQQGSFGEQLYGTKLFIGNGKIESVTKVYVYKKQNNFKFENIYTGNVEVREPVIDIQKGSAIQNQGLLQEINYLFSANHYIKNAVWFEKDWHQIQPNMQTNFRYKSSEELLNQHIRAWSEYINEQNRLKFSIGSGYVHDYQLYDNNQNQLIITNRGIAETKFKYVLNKTIDWRAGAKYQYIVPDVYSYSTANITTEQHLDVYLSTFYQPFKRLKTTLNLRQMLVSNYKAPFTPSFNAEYILSSGTFHLAKLNGNVSRSYRIPTFNDRFWADQGNPNLKPEDGLNVETGFEYHFCNGEKFTTVKVNGFYMDIDNWIEWRNYGIWKAENVQRVISQGIETSVQFHFETGKTKSDITANYSLNKAEKIESKADNTTFKHQLIYTPYHMGNIVYSIEYKQFNAFIDGNFTGGRYSNYLGSKLQPYFLTNAGAWYNFKLRNQGLKLSFQVNNIFNVSYQNEKYYAMPGINFRCGLTLIIKS
ncbi:MAG TPA: TonB-dependent receptor [Prolixibacteraceae bacterium]|nr:TonB-dependent receptor [Prolixibacteraceae bacterium]